MLILYPITSLKTLVSSDNHRMNILHTQSGLLQTVSFFLVLLFFSPFTSFSCFIALLGLLVLNRNGDNGHLYLSPASERKELIFLQTTLSDE